MMAAQRNKHGIPVANTPRHTTSTCTKDMYVSETAARIAASRRPLILFTYFCPRCNAWHLTKKDPN